MFRGAGSYEGGHLWRRAGYGAQKSEATLGSPIPQCPFLPTVAGDDASERSCPCFISSAQTPHRFLSWAILHSSSIVWGVPSSGLAELTHGKTITPDGNRWTVPLSFQLSVTWIRTFSYCISDTVRLSNRTGLGLKNEGFMSYFSLFQVSHPIFHPFWFNGMLFFFFKLKNSSGVVVPLQKSLCFWNFSVLLGTEGITRPLEVSDPGGQTYKQKSFFLTKGRKLIDLKSLGARLGEGLQFWV